MIIVSLEMQSFLSTTSDLLINPTDLELLFIANSVDKLFNCEAELEVRVRQKWMEVDCFVLLSTGLPEDRMHGVV